MLWRAVMQLSLSPFYGERAEVRGFLGYRVSNTSLAIWAAVIAAGQPA